MALGVRPDKAQITVEINGEQVKNTIGDMQKAYRQLNREIRELTPGTEAFINKARQLGEVKKNLDDARAAARAFQQQQTKAEQIMQRVYKSAKRFIAPIAGLFAVERIAAFSGQLLRTGTQLDQLATKSKTVFGEALSSVEDFAKRNATAMGLTRSEYVAAATAAGDLLIPMGFQREEAAGLSTDLVDLSGALSEWTGGQIESTEVSRILTKALLGEREELKQLGISIKESDVQARLAAKGQKELTGAALEQAKALATLELIQEKSVDAQTAFAQNTGNLARQQAVLSATFKDIQERLAKALIPAFSSALQLVNKLTGGTQEYSAALEEERVELNILVSKIGEYAVGTEQRRDLLDELNERYPDFLGNLKAETVSNEQLVDRLKEVNSQYIRRIALEIKREEQTQKARVAAEKLNELNQREEELYERVTKAIEKNNLEIDIGLSLREKAARVNNILLEREIELREKLRRASGDSKGGFATGTGFNDLSGAITAYNNALRASNEAAKESEELLKGVDELAEKFGLSSDPSSLSPGGGSRPPVKVPVQFVAPPDLEAQLQQLYDQLGNQLRNEDQLFAEAAAIDQETQDRLDAQVRARFENRIDIIEGLRQQEITQAMQMARELLEAGTPPEAAQEILAQRLIGTQEEFLERKLSLEKRFGLDTAETQAELEQLRLNMTEERIRKQLEAEQQGREQAIQGELEKQEAIRAIAGQAVQTLNDILAAQGQVIDAQLDREVAALEARQKAKLASEDLTAKQRTAIEVQFQQEREALERQAARKRKELAIGQALINVAEAVTVALTSAKVPFNFILAGLVAAAGGAQISAIRSQSFAQGGNTGRAASGIRPDHTGHKPVGVVHEGEYVAPRWQVENPRYAAAINYLEQGRLRGFAVGGPTTSNIPSNAAIGAVAPADIAQLSQAFALQLGNVIGGVQFVTMVGEREANLVQEAQTSLNTRRSSNGL